MTEPGVNLWAVVIKVRLDMDTSREHRRAMISH
jgi:hypothetical protein